MPFSPNRTSPQLYCLGNRALFGEGLLAAQPLPSAGFSHAGIIGATGADRLRPVGCDAANPGCLFQALLAARVRVCGRQGRHLLFWHFAHFFYNLRIARIFVDANLEVVPVRQQFF